jgi:hypothetical protein
LAATFGAADLPDAWAVSPALPAGLTLDPSSGAISGTPTTAAAGTHTFTATTYGSGSLISARSSIDLALTVSADPALTPSFSAVTSTSNGFTFSVTNFDASYTWGATSTAGAVAVSGAGLITVSGIGASASATVTVTTQRSGYLSGSAQQTGSASTTSTPSNGNTENTLSNDSHVALPRLTTIVPGIFTWNQGVYGRTRVVENSGGVAQYTIKPELPQGMSMNRGTGIIQGSPANTLASTTFVVEASNTSGSSTATIRLQVEAAVTETTVAEDGSAGSVRFRKYSAKLSKTGLVKLGMLVQNLGVEPVTLTGMISVSGQGATLARKRAVQVRKHLRSQGITVGSIILLSQADNSTMTRRVLLTQSPSRPSR